MNGNLFAQASGSEESRLLDWFRPHSGVAVAFSGGVDSSLVAAAAQRVLGDRATAFTSDSPSVPRSELQAAVQLAASLGLRHVVLKTDEFDNPDYIRNSGDRCYFCKSTLYDTITKVLPQYDLHIVCSGANLDDLGDYRPGLSAAAERGIRHPLQECGFTKSMVRELARHWNLPVADKPASPCLSSRLAPGLAVTPERTLRVELAEAYLKSLGFSDGRVRYHDGDLARVELPVEELDRALTVECRDAITTKLRDLGFKFVTIDLEGFRSGSLNQLVSLTVKRKYDSR